MVNPHQIGGSRMGAVALHPNVAEFMDEVLHDESHDVEIEEFAVRPTSPVCGMSCGTIRERLEVCPLLVAIRSPGHDYVANPSPDVTVDENDVIIALGSRAELGELRAFVQGRTVQG